MIVLFEVERFPKAAQNNLLLDAFLYIKQEILKAVEPINEKIKSSNSYIIVTLTPAETSIKYLVSDSKLSDEINQLLSNKMDLTKIANKILDADRN